MTTDSQTVDVVTSHAVVIAVDYVAEAAANFVAMAAVASFVDVVVAVVTAAANFVANSVEDNPHFH